MPPGPAFEGAHIQNGMRASTGAIEKAQMIDGEMKVQTIDQEKAIGICGSGILDIVGSLRASGVMMKEAGAQSAGKKCPSR